jgi:ribulose-phosphate 3-epimerase
MRMFLYGELMMGRRPRIAPSILAADFANLADEIAKVEDNADLLHLDVMDGHYVPNITFGPPIVECVRSITKLFLDTHLMIDNPEKFIKPFAEAGSDNITFHIEVTKEPKKLVEDIRRFGKSVGVSLDPDTPDSMLEPVIDLVDMVLVMTVVPGFGGQAFREDMLPKIERIRRRRKDVFIEVDGGIGEKTIRRVWDAGADTFVAGTSVFRSSNPGQAILKLKETIHSK